MMAHDDPTVYLTKEQLHRLSGIACDALVGIQLHTDDSDQTSVRGEYVHVDHPYQDLTCFVIEADGTFHDTT